MILADTTIWIDFLRYGSPTFAALLDSRRIWVHPFVLGEVACGNLKNREEELRFMRRLPAANTVSDPEALHFIEQNRIMGRGVGYIDAHLLASAAMTDRLKIWTRDKRLHAVALELELAHPTR